MTESNGRQAELESALFQFLKLLHIEAGGVYRRISENREILKHLDLLQLEGNSKVLTETNIFWILDSHHQFMLSLAYLAKRLGLESQTDFELYSSHHDIDNISIFERVGRKLDELPFVIDRLNELKAEDNENE